MEIKRAKLIRKHTDLEVYRRAFDVAMRVFELSRKFPVEERYSLTDQGRRSSRSVVACGYLDKESGRALYTEYDKVIGMLVNMIKRPTDWTMP